MNGAWADRCDACPVADTVCAPGSAGFGTSIVPENEPAPFVVAVPTCCP